MPSIRRPLLALALFALGFGLACDDGYGTDDGSAGPEAPTELVVVPLGAGAHLTWVDNSTDETEFSIMRREASETEYTVLGTVPFDTVQYHDEPIDAMASYMYKVAAVNDAGESDSNEVAFP